MASICNQMCSMKTNVDITADILKKILKGRNRSDDLFKCGSCKSTFETICNLHAHCMKHVDGGSYHFDSFTGTAFPKYDTICTYTQYEFSDVDVFRDKVKQSESDSINIGPECKKRKCLDFKKEQRKTGRRKLTSEDNQSKDSNSFLASDDDHDIENIDNIITLNEVQSNDIAKLEGRETLNISWKADGTETDDFDSLSNIQSSSLNISTNTKDSSSFMGNARRYKNTNNSDMVPGNDELDYLEVEKLKKFVTDVGIEAIGKSSLDDPIEVNGVDETEADKDEESDSDSPGKAETEERQQNDEMTATEALLAIGEGDSRFCGTGNVKRSCRKSTKKNSRTVNYDLVKVEFIDAEEQQEVGQVQNIKEKDSESGTFRRVFECPVCGKTGSASMVSYHKHIHRDTKLNCEKCGVEFQHPSSLKTHMRQHEEKQYSCDQCPASFHRRQYLVTHMLSHTGERPYMCETCGKAYRDVNNLNRHVRHTHEQLRNFECDICHEKFFRIDHMKNHRSRHYDANLKCVYCDKSFKHPADLNRHTKIHTGDRPYQCLLCHHQFITILPFYTHMLKKHGFEREEAKVLHKKWKDQIKISGSKVTVHNMVKVKTKDGNQQTKVSTEDKIIRINICKKQKSKNSSKRKMRNKSKNNDIYQTSTSLDHCDLVLSDRLVESDTDVDHLGGPLYLEGQEIEIGTSNLASDIDECPVIDSSSVKYNTTCSSIDLDHSSYSGNTIFLDREDSLIGYKQIKSHSELLSQQEMATTIQGSHFPLQGSPVTAGADGPERVNLLGIGDSVGPEGERHMVVLGDEGSDLGILPQLEGDSVHAVIVGDYNEYENEVIVDVVT